MLVRGDLEEARGRGLEIRRHVILAEEAHRHVCKVCGRGQEGVESGLVGLYRSPVKACSRLVVPRGEDGVHAVDLGRERGRDVGGGR